MRKSLIVAIITLFMVLQMPPAFNGGTLTQA